ncbi:DUF2017 family protein [Branchiibius cervicis]|uniref:DUF2017 family protein n=1 Tax=Branchiibius cervicis TaxID=908252 RepID=A0ABW2AUX4_9MICO
MATAFQRKGSRIVGTLAPQEREVIVSLLGQVRELLGGDEVAPTGDPLTDLIGELEPTETPPTTTAILPWTGCCPVGTRTPTKRPSSAR